jgi:hypothetical protein
VESAALAKARVEQEGRAARAEALAAESAALEEKSRAAAAAAARALREAGDAARALEAEVDSLKVRGTRPGACTPEGAGRGGRGGLGRAERGAG